MRFAPPNFPLHKWIDPDPYGGDTDPIDYSKYMWKKGGGISNDFIEVWRNIIFPGSGSTKDPDPAPEYQTIIE